MSLAELRAQNKTWIMTRFRLRMERYPRNGDAVTVETWASSRTNGIRAVRQFRFLDSKGAVLGTANSIFLMMDEARKRPVRLPKVVLELAYAEQSDPEEFEIPRLKPPENPTLKRLLEVCWKDLDANDHANNVSYVEWGLEALPLEMNRDQHLAQFDIEFLAEAFYGDQISSEVELGDDVCVHQLKNQAGALLSIATTRWVAGK